MKLSTRNLLIILGVLAIAFAVVQLTKRDGRSKTLRSELVSIDTAAVTKVEINGPSGSVSLSKNGEDWIVQIPSGEKVANGNMVKSMLNNLNTIKPSRLASRKQEKWSEYAVDSAGTRVQVFAGGDVVSDIVLGRFGVEGQRSFHTFVRLYEDDNVYAAKDFMKMSINEAANDYRQNSVARIEQDSLSRITFSYPEESFTLLKGDSWTISGQVADSAAVAEYLKDLRRVTSKEFYDEATIATFDYSVTYSFTDSEDIVITGSTENGNYIVKSSENDVEVFRGQEVWDKFFTRSDVFAETLE